MLFLILVLFSGTVIGAVATSETATISVAPPVPIVNGRSLQIDIRLTAGYKLRVDRIVACSAVDMPFIAYDPSEPGTSGCNSSGYTAYEIYSKEIAASPAGSLASTFRVRQQKNSILMRRHLINRHAPLVRLQMHLSAYSGKTLVEQTVALVHYTISELALPLDAPLEAAGKTAGKNVFGTPINDDGRDDALQATGIIGGGHDTRRPWYMQTIGMFGILLFGAGCALVIWLRVTKKSRKLNKDGDYQQNHYQTIASFLHRATSLGFYAKNSAAAQIENQKSLPSF